MKKNERKNSSHTQSLSSIQRQVVSFRPEELIEVNELETGKTLPIVVKPTPESIDLADWTEVNRKFIEEKLLKHGAILYRGFNLTTASEFERFCLITCPELFNENGEHPREIINSNVYTPVFYPADRKLLWHNENSFNHRWPMKIFFGCRQPAKRGGETPIVDSRKVFDSINPKIRERFIEKKVMYLRNYGHGLGLSWETVFQTKNPLEVEVFCRKAEIDFEWKVDGQLRTRAIRPAVVKHPVTGEMSWFNQAQHWHPACLDLQTRASLFSSFQKDNLPRNCYYGDGTPIEDSVMIEICEVYKQLEISFPWQTGDVLLLDNVLTAHGRNPFIGERQILVAMGAIKSFKDIMS